MYPERYRMPLWTRLTSIAVISALITGCVQKTMGYVTPTPEGANTPTTEPYCDTHMLTYTPELNLNGIDPNSLPIISEMLVGPSGVGEISGINLVKNPTADFQTKVKKAATEKKLDLDVEKSTVVEFGIQGKGSDVCSPFTMILGEENADGTQKAYVGFGTEQIDVDDDGKADLNVLIPPFGGIVTQFLELGQVDTNPDDDLIHLGTVDSLDPEAISPLFSIDQKTGQVVFLSPFYAGDAQAPAPIVPNEFGGNFINVSFNPNAKPPEQATAGPGPTPTKTPAIQAPPATATKEPTATPEVAQFSVCQIEQYRNCVIKAEDLISGKYLEWLNTLSKPFDTSKINLEVPMVYYDQREIAFHEQSAPHFKVEGTAPFRRDVTFGYTSYEGHQYIVMPVEFYDKNNPEKNPWVITVYNIDAQSPEQIEANIKVWRENMNITLIGVNDTIVFAPVPDPLITRTKTQYPNLLELINNFVDFGTGGQQIGDRTALSKPGIILPSYIILNSKGWYE